MGGARGVSIGIGDHPRRSSRAEIEYRLSVLVLHMGLEEAKEDVRG